MILQHTHGGPQSAASGSFAFLPPLPAIKLFKTALADHIERMIDVLDALDSDADNEPDLGSLDHDHHSQVGWAKSGTRDLQRDDADLEEGDDLELDLADDEPSLGSLGGTAMAVDGQHWSGGCGDDLEQDVPTGFRRVRLAMAEERHAIDVANRDLRRIIERLTGESVGRTSNVHDCISAVAL